MESTKSANHSSHMGRKALSLLQQEASRLVMLAYQSAGVMVILTADRSEGKGLNYHASMQPRMMMEEDKMERDEDPESLQASSCVRQDTTTPLPQQATRCPCRPEDNSPREVSCLITPPPSPQTSSSH